MTESTEIGIAGIPHRAIPCAVCNAPKTCAGRGVCELDPRMLVPGIDPKKMTDIEKSLLLALAESRRGQLWTSGQFLNYSRQLRNQTKASQRKSKVIRGLRAELEEHRRLIRADRIKRRGVADYDNVRSQFEVYRAAWREKKQCIEFKSQYPIARFDIGRDAIDFAETKERMCNDRTLFLVYKDGKIVVGLNGGAPTGDEPTAPSLSGKTPACHAGDTGSIPVGAAKLGVKLYRKQSITIQAMKLSPRSPDGRDFFDALEWIKSSGGRAELKPPEAILYITTLEGVMVARAGDYVVRGIRGEFYPVKGCIFEETYTEVAENASAS